FYSVPATSYWGSFPASDTGDPGWMVIGYTAQFGNGFSATIAGEMRRNTQIINESGAGGTLNPGAYGGNNGMGAYGGFQMPDIVANLRVDQAWGSAQVMGAIHQVNALYYNSTGASNQNGTRAFGHPDDELGFAVGAGIKVNAPMIGQGDYLQAQGTYTQGAVRYVFQTPNTNWGKDDGFSSGWGIVSDAVYGGTLGSVVNPATDLELTTAWGVNAAYEHFWNPRWRTSVYGGYAQVSYNGNANNMLCTGNVLAVPTNGCDMDWSTWWVGTRTQWNVTKDFYMGVDVLYSKIQSANTGNRTFAGVGTVASAFNSAATAAVPADDVDNIMIRFRVHRDFYP
ncbi:MAG TPA: porin, partial [Pseudolabrys sp.]|nr:porin [Pseudolabrys sp.]